MRSIVEEEVTIELQHINVKLLLKESENLNLDSVIPVFHSWIQDQIFDELLLDVADYRHVKHGPGLMLIGHEADYSLDNTDGLLGIRYNRKAPLPGTNIDRLIQATRSALLACQRLELMSDNKYYVKSPDAGFDGRLQFNGLDVQLIINDRLLAPNNQTTREAVASDFQRLGAKLFGVSRSSRLEDPEANPNEFAAQDSYSLTYDSDPRRLLNATIRASKPFSTGALLNNLAA